MAERVNTVRLIANVNNYVAGMEKSRLATMKMANDSTAKLAALKEAHEAVGRASIAVGVIAAAAVGLAIAKYAEFDVALSNVKAATQETSENMGLLREAALEAGASSVFSATEAANAIEELGKASISTADILGGALAGSLNLASAGSLGIARAAEITATTLSQFGLAGNEAGRVADVLAAGAGKALGSVDDLANGLKFVGPVAAAMGLSLEETTGVLAMFAQQGIIGEQAGTSLRGMLSSLTSPSKIAAAELERLGVNLYDAQGKFLGVENAAGELGKAYTGVSDQQKDFSLGILFGNEQITAARILYAGGAEGVEKWTKAVDDSGYAAKVARDRLDNLKGDVEALGGAFDTFLINSGSGANDTLRALTQSATFLVGAMGDAEQPVLDAALAIGAVTAGIALTGGAAFLAVPKIVAFKGSLSTLGLSAGATTLKLGIVGAAIGVYTYLIGGAIASQAEMAGTGAELRDSLNQATGAFTAYSREIVAKKLQESGAAAQAKLYGVSLDTLTDAAFNNKDAVAELGKAQAEWIKEDSWRNLDSAVGDTDRTLAGLQKNVRDAPAALAELQKAADTSAGAAEQLSGGLDSVSGTAQLAKEDIDTLSGRISNFGKVVFDSRSANRALEDSIDAATEALKENGATLDLNEESGRANEAALDAIASAANAAAAARVAETGSADGATDALNRGRDALLAQLGAYGITGAAAEVYIAKLLATPDQIATDVILQGIENAEVALARLTRVRVASIEVRSALPDLNGSESGSGRMGTFGSGGYTGSIGRTKVAGIVHGNEWVSDADTTAIPENRAALEFMHAGGNMRDYAAPSFVSPTYVPASPSFGSSSSSSQTVKVDVHNMPVTDAHIGDVVASKVAYRIRGNK